MKKALLVGINDYPGTGNDLGGCVNDTRNLAAILQKRAGFAARDLRSLLDKAATREAIVDGLRWLVSGAAAGDLLVFHYSGHGAQVPDQDEDERADQLDEVICPRDFDWDGVFIRDDDLSEIFAELPRGVLLEVLLDSCHSGTGTREIVLGGSGPKLAAAAALRASRPKRVARLRYLPPPAAVAARVAAATAKKGRVRRFGMLAKARPRGLNHVLWAACRSDQYSADAEIAGEPNGAFTWYFCDSLRASAEAATREAVLREARSGLRTGGFEQQPQLECVAGMKKKRPFAA